MSGSGRKGRALFEALHDRPDVFAELLGEVRRIGKGWLGSCPSCGRPGKLQVYAKDGRAHCHACGWHGDVVDYLRERDGLTEREALRAAAHAAGLPVDEDAPLPRPKPRPVVQADDERKPDPDAVHRVLDSLRELVAEHAQALAAPARRDVERRGLELDGVTYAARPTLDEAVPIRELLDRRQPDWRTAVPWLVDPQRSDAVRLPGYDAAVVQWIRDRQGRLRSAHARVLAPKPRPGDRKPTKYLSVAGAGQWPAHYSVGFEDRLRESRAVVWSEGAFKADIASRAFGCAGLAQPAVGVAAGVRAELAALFEAIGKDGPWTLLAAPDFADLVDPRTKKDSVRQQVRRWKELAEVAELHGATVRWLAWRVGDDGESKAVDDALAAGVEIERLTWDDYRARWGGSSGSPQAAAPRPRIVRHPGDDIGAKRLELKASLDAALAVSPEERRPQSVVTPGGLGKTQATGAALAEDLAAHGGLHAIGLPNIETAVEKQTELAAVAPRLGVEVALRIGAQPEATHGWFCSQHKQRERRIAVGLPPCSGCPARTACASTAGHYLHDRDTFRRRARSAVDGSGPPVMVLATHAALAVDLERGVLPLTRRSIVVLDDVADPLLGLAVEEGISARSLRTVVGSAESWWRGANWSAAMDTYTAQLGEKHPRLPTVLVARAVDLVGRWLLSRDHADRNPDPAALPAVLAEVGDDIVRGIVAGHAVAPRASDHEEHGWPFENGGAPGVTALVLRVVQAAAAGDVVDVHDEHPLVVVRRPANAIVTLARRGQIAWLGVAPVLDSVQRTLNVPVLRVDAHNEHSLAIGVGGKGWGAGIGDGAERNARSVRAWYRSLRSKDAAGGVEFEGTTYRGLGAVLHLEDRKALRKELGDDLPLVRHYGAGHSATNGLSSCGVLLVRRYARPPRTDYVDARALARILGFAPPAPPTWRTTDDGRAVAHYPTVVQEQPWPGRPDLPPARVRVPADPLVAEVAAYSRALNVLNATARHRPLNATADAPKLALVLDGPVEGLRYSAVIQDGELMRQLGLDTTAEPDLLLSRSAATADRRARIDEDVARLLDAEPGQSIRQIAEALGLSRWAVADSLQRLAPLGSADTSVPPASAREGGTDLSAQARSTLLGSADTSVPPAARFAPLLAVAGPDRSALGRALGFKDPVDGVKKLQRRVREAIGSGAPLDRRRRAKFEAALAALRGLEAERLSQEPDPAPSAGGREQRRDAACPAPDPLDDLDPGPEPAADRRQARSTDPEQPDRLRDRRDSA